MNVNITVHCPARHAAVVLWCRSLGEGSFSPSAFARLVLQPLAPSQAQHSLRGADLKLVENPPYVRS
jgi:hypothetical protein